MEGEPRSVTGWARDALGRASVGRLATVRPDGRPHVVPATFALLRPDAVVTAVDGKPKRTTDLQRLRNLQHQPQAALLVDGYHDDWDRLWWVRLDCWAEVVTTEPERSELVRPLAHKYPQYGDCPPAGPAVRLTVQSWTAWSARAEGPDLTAGAR